MITAAEAEITPLTAYVVADFDTPEGIELLKEALASMVCPSEFGITHQRPDYVHVPPTLDPWLSRPLFLR